MCNNSTNKIWLGIAILLQRLDFENISANNLIIEKLYREKNYISSGLVEEIWL